MNYDLVCGLLWCESSGNVGLGCESFSKVIVVFVCFWLRCFFFSWLFVLVKEWLILLVNRVMVFVDNGLISGNSCLKVLMFEFIVMLYSIDGWLIVYLVSMLSVVLCFNVFKVVLWKISFSGLVSVMCNGFSIDISDV